MAQLNENMVIDILKQCFDPEIPIDLWSLGLIYKIDLLSNSNGKTDINRLHIKLLDQYGRPVDLNGMDFSLTLGCEVEN